MADSKLSSEVNKIHRLRFRTHVPKEGLKREVLYTWNVSGGMSPGGIYEVGNLVEAHSHASRKNIKHFFPGDYSDIKIRWLSENRFGEAYIGDTPVAVFRTFPPKEE